MKIDMGKKHKQKSNIESSKVNGIDEPDCFIPLKGTKLKSKAKKNSDTSQDMDDSDDENEQFSKMKSHTLKSKVDVSKLENEGFTVPNGPQNCCKDGGMGSKNLKHKLNESDSKNHKGVFKKTKLKHKLENRVAEESNEFEDSDSGFHEVELKHQNIKHNFEKSVQVGKPNQESESKCQVTSGKSDIKEQKTLTKLKSKSLDSSAQADSSTSFTTQGDYDFFKFHLDMIPPKFLEGATVDDDEDDEETHQLQPPSKWKKSDGKGKPGNKTTSQASDISSTDTYSKIKEKMKHKKNKKKDKKTSKSSDNEDRRQMLREKLLARIEELKGKRNLTTDEIIEKKKLRRKQSKLKTKMKKKEGNTTKEAIPEEAIPEEAIPEKKPVVTPVKDKKSGKMVFSKFDFVDSGEKEASQSKLKGKDYKRLLEKVEKKKEKIDKIKETNPQQAKTMHKKEAWKNVIMKAEGEKIKDDPNLLKKSLKKKEKMKEKRKKKWEDRQSQTENRMKAQQDKRQKNIHARKQAKTDKKIKRAKKKGRMVPGF